LRLADILRSAARIEEVLQGGYETFSKSWLSQSAVVRELEIIGEAAGKVSLSIRKLHPDVEWQKLRGFSSFAKHEHWRIDPNLLWRAVEEVPTLRNKVGRVSPRLE
jgi:uncharacterized protein with HEPN domain